MTPEQTIIERLYQNIDVANKELIRLEANFRISRCLETFYVEIDPRPSNIPISMYTGNFCTVCGGMMVQTGSCQTCQNCGTTSGGCD